MIHYPSIETTQKMRNFGVKQRMKRLLREKRQHKQNCYKAQKIKLRMMELMVIS